MSIGSDQDQVKVNETLDYSFKLNIYCKFEGKIEHLNKENCKEKLQTSN